MVINMVRKEKKEYETRIETRTITIRVPLDLLERMGKIRKAEGIAITFQVCKGTEMYLKTKEK